MQARRGLLKGIRESKWVAAACAVVGVLVFVLQIWKYAHTQTSFVDEGMYLFLGYRFAAGLNTYGQLGVWNYYAPLSFLVPGAIQAWLGPGLQIGRFFSIFLSLLMLFPLWLTARRFGGGFWAAALIWVLALSPLQIKMYSLGLSQALTACLLAWCLALALGENRPLWQILAASLLAGLLVMTRHNMAPLLPLLVGYIFWQHGRKAGWWSVLACTLPVATLSVIFWPSIMRLWSIYWLPIKWFSALGPPANSSPALNGNSNPGLVAQFSAFFMGFRAHYVALLGAFAALLVWPRRGQWISKTNMRAAWFLATTFFVLLLVHAWASLMYTQCTFCFAPYTAFYGNIALLLVVVSFSSWVKKPLITRQVLIVIFLLLVSLGVGWAAYDKFGDWLLALPMPRLSGGLKPGEWVTLWDYVGNKTSMGYFVARMVLPPFASLAGGLFLLLLVFCGLRLVQKRKRMLEYSFGAAALNIFLAVGFVITPLMNGNYRQDGECSQDVLKNYASIGQGLASLVTPGSPIYWQVSSAVPLLYLKDANLHLAQVFGSYSYRIGGNAAAVEASGYWNEELARNWMNEADFVILDNDSGSFAPKPGDVLPLEAYRLTELPPANPCKPDDPIFVYQRIP